MRDGLDQQYRAVASGYWPLIRYDPMRRTEGGNPFLLDSPRPRIALADYTTRELRYRTLANTDPDEAERLHGLAEHAVARRWDVYEEMATYGAEHFAADGARMADGLVDRLHGPLTPQSADRVGLPALPSPSTRSGASPTPASALWSSTRSSRSSCVARRPRRAARGGGRRQLRGVAPYFPAAAEEVVGPRRYLSLIERAVAAVDVPVIGVSTAPRAAPGSSTRTPCRRPARPRSS